MEFVVNDLQIVLCVSYISISPNYSVSVFFNYISLLLLLADTVGFPRTHFLQPLPDSSRAAFLCVTSATGVSGAMQENRFHSMWITVAEIGPKFRMSSKQIELIVAWILRASLCKCSKGHLAAIVFLFVCF